MTAAAGRGLASRLAGYPPLVFLFVLPIAHTTPLRHLCLALSVVAAVLAWRRSRPAHGPARWLVVAIAFWFVVCAAATLASGDFEYSQGEFRNEVVYTLAAFAIFWCLTDGEAAWRRWQLVLLASFFTAAALCIGSFVAHRDFVRATWVGDRNAYSTYVVLIYPLLLWTAFGGSDRRIALRVAGGVAIALAFATGALTLNRNMWIGMAIESAVFPLLLLRLRAGRRLPSRMVLVAAMAGLVVFAAIFTFVNREKNAAATVSAEQLNEAFTKDPRLEIWDYAVQRIEERPWTGYGYGRGILRRDFRERFGMALKWHGHNVVLNYGLEAGIAGMAAIALLFLALFAWCWTLYRRADPGVRPLGALGMTMIAGIALKIMTDDILVRDNALLFWSVLGMVGGLAAGRRTSAP